MRLTSALALLSALTACTSGLTGPLREGPTELSTQRDAEGRCWALGVAAGPPRSFAARQELRFQAICDQAYTPELVVTLQRALAARGYYCGQDTGRFDDRTRRALRAYQVSRGLDSEALSVETAGFLGLLRSDAPE